MANQTPNLECRMYEAKYPEVDMAVMIQVKNIADMGAYVSLLEYNNIEGMILFSELSRRRIRSVSSLIKVGKIEPVMVLRVDKEKIFRLVKRVDAFKRQFDDLQKYIESIGNAIDSNLKSNGVDLAASFSSQQPSPLTIETTAI